MANITLKVSSPEDASDQLDPFSLLLECVIICLSAVSLWSIAHYVRSPLNKYPGPLIARFTRLWYLYQVSTGNSHLVLYDLHRKYGSIVRITPDIIDIDIPGEIKTIFKTRSGWLKVGDCTPFYHGGSALVDGRVVHNLFSQTDPEKHRRERKPIAKHYSSRSIKTLEQQMDKVIRQLCRQLEERYLNAGDDSGRACNLGRWILYYAWDVVGAVTFSEPIGYLEKGYDFDGTLHVADKAMDYFAMVGTMPFLDKIFAKNAICRLGPPGFGTITRVCFQRLMDRCVSHGQDRHEPGTPDFLDKFIEARDASAPRAPDEQVVSWLMINMIAGADTTAITIRSALYFSLKHPRVWRRLTADVLGAGFSRRTPPRYEEVKALPFVDAVVRESLRFLPGVSMTMERYVPRGGFTLTNGDHLPEGTIVGMNPYILARDKSVYGKDADCFRPERWLRDEQNDESEEDFRERLHLMDQTDLSFGGGSRACIGKHLGLYQTYKVFATLVARYEIELVDPDREWKVINSWFPRQEGLEVKLRKRNLVGEEL